MTVDPAGGAVGCPEKQPILGSSYGSTLGGSRGAVSISAFLTEGTHTFLLNYNPKQLCQLCIYSSISACYRPVLWRRCYERKTRLEQVHAWGKAPVMVDEELDQRVLVNENGV